MSLYCYTESVIWCVFFCPASDMTRLSILFTYPLPHLHFEKWKAGSIDNLLKGYI